MHTPSTCATRRLCFLFQNGGICSLRLLVLIVAFALYSKMAAFSHNPSLYFSSPLLSIPKLQPAQSPGLYFSSSLLSIPKLQPAQNPFFISHRHCPLFQNCLMLKSPACAARRLCSNPKMAAFAHSPS
jgi:hypothetical protein